MDRRKSIKTLLIGTASAGILIESCEPKDQKVGTSPSVAATVLNEDDRMAEEKIADKALCKETFFTPEEMATISILADTIIPKDAVSGSASEAKVPDFIEFIVKDMPENKTPMRGGLRWLIMQSLKRLEKSFTGISDA